MIDYIDSSIDFDEKTIEKLDKYWSILSRSILENIKNNSKLRKEILGWSKNYLSETNAYDFLNSGFSFDLKVKNIISNYKEELIDILGSNNIEEKIDGNDIRNSLLNPKEKELLLKKYSYSRDVKMLLFTSELLDSNINFNGQENIELESGINIKNNLDELNDLNILLDVKNWKGRKKIKDRVYEVTIGDKKYILKEKKTKFHKDTIGDGHIDGISSLEEFNLAKKFNKIQNNNDGIFKLTYEKPLTTVSFPDGFQFTIFEYNDILNEEKLDRGILANMIFKNKEQFYDNYLNVCSIYEKYLDNEKVIFQSSFFNNVGLFNKIKNIFTRDTSFSYKDYSYVKANHLLGKESLVYENNILKGGYYNDDGCQYNTKVDTKENGEIEIEMFIYDFEYFLKVNDNDIEFMLSDNIDKFKKYDFYIYRNYGKLDGSHREAFAASFALQELDGLI